jgi:hypothetical protein
MAIVHTTVTLTVHGILYLLSALLILSSIGMLFSQMKGLELVKKQKCQLVTTLLMGGFVILNLVYWQMWMFWVY